MKAKDLVSLWETPDNTRLTAKQTSIRFPVHIAAKIAALCEMYPKKTRTEIIGDLLASSLEEMERSFPFIPGAPFGQDEEGETLFLDTGPGKRFRDLANKYYKELEEELGNPDAPGLYTSEVVGTKEN